jgi:hypothetical protein
MTLYQDNKSAIFMTTTESKYKNAKHILTKVAYAKNLQLLGRYIVINLPTKLMWTDMLTKPRGVSLLKHHRVHLMGGFGTDLDNEEFRLALETKFYLPLLPEVITVSI